MLGIILLYAAGGEALGGSVRPRILDPAIDYAFATAGVAIVGVIFIVRRTLVLRSEKTLLGSPENVLALRSWRNGYFATYALCEALALCGFIQRLLGGTFPQSIPFYLGGFALLFFFGPKEVAGA
jgi:hypothetical protein